VQLLLDVFVFPPTGLMLDSKDHDLVVRSIDTVVHEVGISSNDKLSDALDLLPPAQLREKHKVLQRTENDCSHANRSVRISLMNVVGNLSKIVGRAPRKPKLHRSKRRNAASTSASLANSRRLA